MFTTKMSTLVGLALFLATIGHAPPQETESPFKKGSVISEFGNVAAVDSDVVIPEGTVFKVRFDVGRRSNSDSINTTFDSAARFINVNVAAGMPKENIRVAIVVHGSATIDVASQEFYGSKSKGRENLSEEAIATLMKHNVQFFLCGQSAAYQGITKKDLLKGVKIAPSAMTMHALLDQQGYSLNPF